MHRNVFIPNRRGFLHAVMAILVLALAVPAAAQPAKESRSTSPANGPIPVVATFSILGDMVARIGGEHIDLTTLVGPDGDTHMYQPTPADARAVSEAQILFVNGLQFEGWLERLTEAADFHGVLVVATDGIEPIAFEHGEHADEHDMHDDEDEHDHDEDEEHDDHDEHDDEDEHGHEEDEEHHDHGVFDPHAWQSLRHALVYVENIAAALAKADPGNADAYERNREAYADELEALDSEILKLLATLPPGSRTVVTSHDAFQYFGRDYGLTFIAPQGLSTESEASAQDVARLIHQIRDLGIRAVFVENITDPRLLERIADETGAGIGGTLYPGALSGPDGPAPTYLDMMRHNATTIAQALTSEDS